MTLRTPARLGLAALAITAVASCAAPTQLVSSWTDPAAAEHTYQKVVVVGATPQTTIRRLYEDTFASELQSRGMTAVPSYTFAEGKLTNEVVAAKLEELGADGIIVTRLVDKEQTQNYVPGTTYGGWYGYYGAGYGYSSPGYSYTSKVYRIETNLYDVQNNKLAWSGITETTLLSGDSPEIEIRPQIAALLYDMEKHKVLPKRTK
jgi:hypothetical protein